MKLSIITIACFFIIINLFLINEKNKSIEELKNTIQYISDPNNDVIIVIDENIKSKQERIRIKIDDLILSNNYPRYLNFEDLNELSRLIIKYSKRYNLKEELIISLINTESSFNQYAISKNGALGLMQIMPSTAETISMELKIYKYDLFDLETNIRFGSYYLKNLLKDFDINHAVMAYNSGPENVKHVIKNGGLFYKETEQHNVKVMNVFEKLNYQN